MIHIRGPLVALILLATPALAHDAPPSKMQPLGWQYGWECCNLMDCFQAEPGSVEETPGGYLIKETGEVIPYDDTKRIKQSKDEYFHRCTHGGKHDDPKSICLYVPDRGF